MNRPALYKAIFDESFPGNPIPFANALAQHVRDYGTTSVTEDEYKKLLWILMGQAYGQMAIIDLHDEWNRLERLEHSESGPPYDAATATGMYDHDY